MQPWAHVCKLLDCAQCQMQSFQLFLISCRFRVSFWEGWSRSCAHRWLPKCLVLWNSCGANTIVCPEPTSTADKRFAYVQLTWPANARSPCRNRYVSIYFKNSTRRGGCGREELFAEDAVGKSCSHEFKCWAETPCSADSIRLMNRCPMEGSVK